MKTRKTYLIIEMHTNKILHTTTDLNESVKEFEKLKKTREVTTECRFQ